MSYCEDYIDPFDREPYSEPDDDHEWDCLYPNECLMPSILHTKDECYTVEDAEAYYAEMEKL